MQTGGASDAKRELRRQLLATRAARSDPARRQAATDLGSRVLDLREVARASTVAAYVSTPEEPGTGPLLSALLERGVRVLLPLLRADLDLEWAEHRGGSWHTNRFGIPEPATASLGLDAIAQAEVVCCPGLAGDLSGRRLGRGGGSYDRALARAAPASLRCLLLYDDEVLADVPTHVHDRPVDVIVTPARTLRVS